MKADGRIEKFERLIVRKLDGELTQSEQLEFDRAMVSSADVRALYESYCEIDDLAATVIRSCTGSSTTSEVHSDVQREKPPVLNVPYDQTIPHGQTIATQPRRHMWMTYASALAACLALVLIWNTPDSSDQQSVLTAPPDAGQVGTNRLGQDLADGNFAVGDGSVGRGWPTQQPRLVPTVGKVGDEVLGREIGVWNASDIPAQRLDRFTDKNLIVIPSENGGYYLFTIDHVRQVRQPKAQADSLLWNKPI
ncbi:MAG: hypothetical protein GXP29_01300 [Planctomycetes bacterium]|nr:hypothetical protein [Planctomycetota bacterium]